MLNQPSAVICVPVDIFETSTFACGKCAKTSLERRSLGRFRNYQPATDIFFTDIFSLVIAQFDGRAIEVVGRGAVGI
jgi:hypothetical protein